MNINEFYIFSQLDEQHKALLEKHIRTKTLTKGQILFFQGDPSRCLYMLESGSVKAYKTDAHGREIIMHHFHAPCLIAEMATFEGIDFPASLSCESDAKVLCLPRDIFLKLLQSDVSLAMGFIASMSKKIKILESSIERNMAMNAMQRVALTIMESPQLFEHLPQTKIASMLNITPETLSRMLKKLKNEEVIIFERKRPLIIDETALLKLVEP